MLFPKIALVVTLQVAGGAAPFDSPLILRVSHDERLAQDRQMPEATSLFGKPLISVQPTGETKARLEADLTKARADYDRDPSSADAAIWLGRRLAYLGRFNDAIASYTRGIERHPIEPRLYRHRGHRYITIRKFDLAIADLRRARS